MPHTQRPTTGEQLLDTLEQLSDDLYAEPDAQNIMKSKTIEDELRAFGADVEGFHEKFEELLGYKLPGEPVLSYHWIPDGTGDALVAANASVTQEHEFDTELGIIKFTCAWGRDVDNDPAFIWLSWNADILQEAEFVIRLLEPDTQKPLYDVRPGTIRQGNQTLTTEQLGFHPLQTRWSITILLSK